MEIVRSAILAFAIMLGYTQAYAAGCSVQGGWPGAQYGQQAQILFDSLPCYGITGTKNSAIVLQNGPTLNAPVQVGGANALAFAVGRQGNISPGFSVDTLSGGLGITGLSIVPETSGNGVNLIAIGETNVPIIVNAAGNGTISLNPTGTGSINLYRNTFVLHDSNPTLTLGLAGGSLAHIATPGTSGLSFDTNTSNSQVKILDTASANRQITFTGSNGGNPTIGTSAGSLAITPAVVGAAGINGSMAANSIKCNNTGSPTTSIDCTVPQTQALINQGVINIGITGINANSANTDNSFTVTLPTGYTKYRINSVLAYNPSTSLTTATAGVFTGAGGTGTTVVTTVALSALTTNTAGSSGSLLAHTVVNSASAFFNSGTIFYRIVNAQGSAATVDVIIQIAPLP